MKGYVRPRAGKPSPLPQQLNGARELANLSQKEAAAIIYCSERAWQDWEAGRRRMHPQMWEAFVHKLKARLRLLDKKGNYIHESLTR